MPANQPFSNTFLAVFSAGVGATDATCFSQRIGVRRSDKRADIWDACELLLVIAIIGTLAAPMLPASQAARGCL